MAKKFGLGRGLDALMSDSSDKSFTLPPSVQKEASKSEVLPSKVKNIPQGIEVDEEGGLWVNPDLLLPNPKQPRKDFKSQELDELASSIKEHGVIEPILIEKGPDSKFYIIAGERRTRAAKIAGVNKVPVQIRKYDDVKKLEIALIENIQRSDLNPIEEAHAYYELMQLDDIGQEEVARRVGKKRPTIANAIRLLKLPSDMQKALIEGKITSGHARALLSVESDSDMRVLFGKIVGSGLSVREAETMAQYYNNGGRATESVKTKVKPKKDPDVSDIEQKFIKSLGTKVVLKGNLEKGSITIDYFSKDDLERLYNVIIGQ